MKLKGDHVNGGLKIKYKTGAITECGWMVTLETSDKVGNNLEYQVMNHVYYNCLVLFYL